MALHAPQQTAVTALQYVLAHNLAGDLVECGVYQGDKPILWCRYLLERQTHRNVYLYDTFAGMTKPEPTVDHKTDGSLNGTATLARYHQRNRGRRWHACSLQTVKRNLQATGYPVQYLHYVKGDVCTTLPGNRHGQIAILRLDTDWYHSTRCALQHLYPKVVAGGVVIVDDYGTWRGQQRAVDEYLAAHRIDVSFRHTCHKEVMFYKP